MFAAYFLSVRCLYLLCNVWQGGCWLQLDGLSLLRPDVLGHSGSEHQTQISLGIPCINASRPKPTHTHAHTVSEGVGCICSRFFLNVSQKIALEIHVVFNIGENSTAGWKRWKALWRCSFDASKRPCVPSGRPLTSKDDRGSRDHVDHVDVTFRLKCHVSCHLSHLLSVGVTKEGRKHSEDVFCSFLFGRIFGIFVITSRHQSSIKGLRHDFSHHELAPKLHTLAYISQHHSIPET